MTMVREGTITTILTYRYDRFGRNLRQALNHLEEVEALGGQVISVTEPFDASTAIGKFMRSNSLNMADLQSNQMSEGWKRVHQYRIERGLPTHGRERYGYLAHRSTHIRRDGAVKMCPQGCDTGQCETGFVPDPETAPVVQRIYEEYIAGKGFQTIAHGLNDDDIPTPGQVAAERSGNPTRIARTEATTWGANSVIDVADTGFAAGLITHHDAWHPGAHEPLITEQQWTAYQARREAQRLTPTKARSPRWALAGIAVCGECDGPMYCTSSPRGEQYALYCGTARTSGRCGGTYRTRAAVEAAVTLWLQSVVRQVRTPSALKFTDTSPKRRDPFEAERRKLTKVVAAAEKKLSRLLDAHIDGAIKELGEYKRRRDEIQQAADQAQARLTRLEAQPAQPPTPAAVKGFAALWSSWDVESRREVAQAMLEQVRVYSDKHVELRPRWADPVAVTYTRRGSTPVLPDSCTKG